MSASYEPTASDHTFYKHASLIREALLNFAIISQLNAPGPIKLQMEELINISVSAFFHLYFILPDFALFRLNLVASPLFITLMCTCKSFIRLPLQKCMLSSP